MTAMTTTRTARPVTAPRPAPGQPLWCLDGTLMWPSASGAGHYQMTVLYNGELRCACPSYAFGHAGRPSGRCKHGEPAAAWLRQNGELPWLSEAQMHAAKRLAYGNTARGRAISAERAVASGPVPAPALAPESRARREPTLVEMCDDYAA